MSAIPRPLASLLLALCVVWLAVPSPANAGGPSREQKQRAKAHFTRGAAAYEHGDFDTAIREYQAAYDIAPLPDILFDVAQAHRKKGERGPALELYRRALAEGASGAVAVEAKSAIAALQQEEAAATRQRAAQAQAEAARRRREEDAARARAALARPLPVRGGEQADLVGTAGERSAASSHRRWLWVSLGAGAVLVAALAVGLAAAYGGTDYTSAARAGCAAPGCVLVDGGFH